MATLVASLLSVVSASTFYDAVARGTNISAIETANSKVNFVRVYTKTIDAQNYGFKCEEMKVREFLKNTNNKDFDVALYEYVNHKNGATVMGKSEFLELIRKSFVDAYGEQINERLPGYVQMYFKKEALNDPKPMRTLMGMLYDGKTPVEKTAEYVEDSYSRVPTTEVLQIFIYLIIFSILMVIAALISAFMQNRLFFNITKGSERLYGALLGLMEALAMVAVFTIVIRLTVLLSGDSLKFLNENTIHQTKLFSFLYDNIGFLL